MLAIKSTKNVHQIDIHVFVLSNGPSIVHHIKGPLCLQYVYHKHYFLATWLDVALGWNWPGMRDGFQSLGHDQCETPIIKFWWVWEKKKKKKRVQNDISCLIDPKILNKNSRKLEKV